MCGVHVACIVARKPAQRRCIGKSIAAHAAVHDDITPLLQMMPAEQQAVVTSSEKIVNSDDVVQVAGASGLVRTVATAGSRS